MKKLALVLFLVPFVCLSQTINPILDTSNATLSITNFKGSTQNSLGGVPLGTVGNSATGELGAKVIVIGGGGTPTVTLPANTRTIAISSVSTGGTVAAGKHYIEFQLSSDFAGTIAGATYSGSTTAVKPFPVLQAEDVYAALTYTISAGSALLTTF